MKSLKPAILRLLPVLLLPAVAVAHAAEGVQLVVTPAPAQLPQDAQGTPIYLKIAARVPARDAREARLPVNAVLLLDASASMAGEKLARAREAAAEAIGAMRPGDTVAVVTYSSTVRVLVPAVRIHDPLPLVRALDAMEASGDTALFAGLSKAAGELMKYRSPDRVNRIVLLSDGRANVGPGGTDDLVRLAELLRRDGITISTIGLGNDYFEDLMVELALVGGGNHFYAETPGELLGIFQYEFTQAVDAAARDVLLEMVFDGDVQPTLALGHGPQLSPEQVTAHLGPLFMGHEKYLIVEMRLRPGTIGRRALGWVQASYTDARTGAKVTPRMEAFIDVVAPGEAGESAQDREVLEAFMRQVGAGKSRAGMDLMDRGEFHQGAALLRESAEQLEAWADRLDSAVLREDAARTRRDAEGILAQEFEERRKSMRFYQNVITHQAPALPPGDLPKSGAPFGKEQASP